ncbi:MAG: hypothetical protein A3F16_02125 [Deltaproteobacteria bacterium RIFCSPHIGHO2_12_FULL_43_9]|nr:MAG: hypothetical protein A3F16_02125 [Deltaproteobacteria bacterium RIFCSPHIGHO2_12_FULL_43_9]
MLKKTKTIEKGLVRGLEEALAHSNGKLALKETVRELPGPAPIWKPKEIQKLRREVFSMSQSQFAILLNVSLPTIQAWEQGQKTPSGSAARLLELISMDSDILEKLLAA